MGEYAHELWRRYHRINPVEQALVGRALLRRRRAHRHDDTQEVQDLCTHNPARLQHTVGGLRYLLAELARVIAATRDLPVGASVMQPTEALSAQLHHTLLALVKLCKQAPTTAAAVIGALGTIQRHLREALVEEETVAKQFSDIEEVICRLPPGKRGELLLRYLRQSDRRLASLRRRLEPIRRPRRPSGEPPAAPRPEDLTA
jgi:hypothetical protein